MDKTIFILTLWCYSFIFILFLSIRKSPLFYHFISTDCSYTDSTIVQILSRRLQEQTVHRFFKSHAILNGVLYPEPSRFLSPGLCIRLCPVHLCACPTCPSFMSQHRPPTNRRCIQCLCSGIP